MQIRTKWHRVMPLVDADEVYVTAPPGGLAHHWSDYKPNKELFRGLLGLMDPLPRFVIDKELIELAQKEEYNKSLFDMKKAGVLRLPFPAMVVEYTSQGTDGGGSAMTHSICLLRDLYHKELMPWEDDIPRSTDIDFYGLRISVERDSDSAIHARERGLPNSDYLVVSPSWSHLGMSEDEVNVKMAGVTHDIFTDVAKANALTESTWTKDCGVVFFAAAAGFLLMATKGVAKEVVDTDRINKKRRTDGKPLIPRHTYVHIGRVYRSAASQQADDYVPRRSPLPHWRRGHLKNVRYGKGREFIRAKYIYPKLVAYTGDFEPKRPDYFVTK